VEKNHIIHSTSKSKTNKQTINQANSNKNVYKYTHVHKNKQRVILKPQKSFRVVSFSLHQKIPRVSSADILTSKFKVEKTHLALFRGFGFVFPTSKAKQNNLVSKTPPKF